MKKHIFFVVLCLSSTISIFAQWNPTGNNSSTGFLTLGNSNENGIGKRHLTLLGSDLDYSNINLHFNFNNKLSALMQAATPGGNTTDLIFFTAPSLGVHTPKMVIKGGGNVGIGIDAPLYKLDVNGDIRANALYLKSVNPGASWLNSTIYYPGHTLVIGSPKGNNTDNYLDIKPGGSPSGMLSSGITMWVAHAIDNYEKKVQIRTAGVTYFNGGNVGIGTDAPTVKLDVRGVISAEEVKVQILTGMDRVFNADYELRPLSEVKAFVEENKHLPEIPSEKHMQENGLNMNEFQIKLLQKIEELTLYVIKQDEEIQKLKVALSEK